MPIACITSFSSVFVVVYGTEHSYLLVAYDSAIWLTIERNNVSAIGSHKFNKTSGGWSGSVNIDPNDLFDCEWCSQFFWIDELVGHGMQIGIDKISKSFNEIYRRSGSVDSRQAKRRYKKFASIRRNYTNWLNANHVSCGGEASIPLITSEKKVYMKKINRR